MKLEQKIRIFFIEFFKERFNNIEEISIIKMINAGMFTQTFIRDCAIYQYFNIQREKGILYVDCIDITTEEFCITESTLTRILTNLNKNKGKFL